MHEHDRTLHAAAILAASSEAMMQRYLPSHLPAFKEYVPTWIKKLQRTGWLSFDISWLWLALGRDALQSLTKQANPVPPFVLTTHMHTKCCALFVDRYAPLDLAALFYSICNVNGLNPKPKHMLPTLCNHHFLQCNIGCLKQWLNLTKLRPHAPILFPWQPKMQATCAVSSW